MREREDRGMEKEVSPIDFIIVAVGILFISGAVAGFSEGEHYKCLAPRGVDGICTEDGFLPAAPPMN